MDKVTETGRGRSTTALTCGYRDQVDRRVMRSGERLLYNIIRGKGHGGRVRRSGNGKPHAQIVIKKRKKTKKNKTQ